MSGLETAIRNALDRSDRKDGDTRARIYQSARQALDAGLQRQGVTDKLIILQQRKRLEEKIREIETEEAERAADGGLVADNGDVRPPEPDASTVYAAPPVVASPAEPLLRKSVPPDAMELGGVTRERLPEDEEADAILGVLGEDRTNRAGSATPSAAAASPVPMAAETRGQKKQKLSRRDKRRQEQAAAASVGRRGKRRRSLMSRFLTWVITLIIVAGGCWWFYTSGMVQSVIQDALRQANEIAGGQAGGSAHFDPRGGFSDDWVEIFKPSDAAKLVVGQQARAEAASASEGPAVRLNSAVAGPAGDIAIVVPADVLRAMAGRQSTIALTLQAGLNEGVQVSVGCDFGSMGSCPRHRFTATQENFEALFKVNFAGAQASGQPGRIVINTGVNGAGKPVYLYDLRILPGQ